MELRKADPDGYIRVCDWWGNTWWDDYFLYRGRVRGEPVSRLLTSHRRPIVLPRVTFRWPSLIYQRKRGQVLKHRPVIRFDPLQLRDPADDQRFGGEETLITKLHLCGAGPAFSGALWLDKDRGFLPRPCFISM